MMRTLFVFAMVLGQCAATDVLRRGEDLSAESPEDAPTEHGGETLPPSASPSTQPSIFVSKTEQVVAMTLSGSVENYNETYFQDTLFPIIRSATGLTSDIDLVLRGYSAGSVIVYIRVLGPNPAAFSAFVNNLVSQANNPNSALRQALGVIQGAIIVIVPTPVGDDDGLSDAAIAGIVIGTVTGAAIIGVLLWHFCKADGPAEVQPSQEQESGIKEKPAVPYPTADEDHIEKNDDAEV